MYLKGHNWSLIPARLSYKMKLEESSSQSDARRATVLLLIAIIGGLVILVPISQAPGLATGGDNGSVNKTPENIAHKSIFAKTSKFTPDKKLPSTNALSKSNVETVSGSGKGSFTCSDGTRVNDATISFIGFMTRLPSFGSWEIVTKGTSSINSLSKGAIQGGTIIDDNYNLNGIQISDKICDKTSVGTTAELTGQCGQGVAITLLNAKSSEKGAFSGKVVCSTDKLH